MPRETSAAVDQSGRPLGRRALQTRERLLDATRELLAERSVRDVSVVEIARKAGTSPATFYQYFKDVTEATLRLAQRAAQEMPVVVELIGRSWQGPDGVDTARAIVDAFLRHWDTHRAVLLVRNLAADEGDDRFQETRRRALAPVVSALSTQIAASQDAGRVESGIHAAAAAVAIASVLERLATYHREIEPLGVSRDDLVETTARIVYHIVTGRSADYSA